MPGKTTADIPGYSWDREVASRRRDRGHWEPITDWSASTSPALAETPARPDYTAWCERINAAIVASGRTFRLATYTHIYGVAAVRVGRRGYPEFLCGKWFQMTDEQRAQLDRQAAEADRAGRLDAPLVRLTATCGAPARKARRGRSITDCKRCQHPAWQHAAAGCSSCRHLDGPCGEQPAPQQAALLPECATLPNGEPAALVSFDGTTYAQASLF